MKYYPDKKDALRRIYRTSQSFQNICQNYQKCTEALKYWEKSRRPEAPERYREYSALLQELKLEITKSLENQS
jgi:hypothetical protein